ncbi:hypothetical protein OSTOST_11583, partial [Ostertagia ostertagi]
MKRSPVSHAAGKRLCDFIKDKEHLECGRGIHYYTINNDSDTWMWFYMDRRTDSAGRQELWPVKPQEFLPERTFEWRRYLYLVVHGRLNEDGSYPNILNGSYLDEIARMEADLAANITFNEPTTMGNEKDTFAHDSCITTANATEISNMIRLLQRRHELEAKGITVTYPQANTGGTPIYLAFNIGGVDTFPNDTIKSVHAMRIWYFLRFDTPTLDAMAKEWEEAGAKYVREKYGDNPLIKCHIKHSRIVDQGL